MQQKKDGSPTSRAGAKVFQFPIRSDMSEPFEIVYKLMKENPNVLNDLQVEALCAYIRQKDFSSNQSKFDIWVFQAPQKEEQPHFLGFVKPVRVRCSP